MKTYKTIYWKDKKGQIIERGFQNGIVSQMLRGQPEPDYIQNTLMPAQMAVVRDEKQIEKEVKIQQKMREIAERELEKEGKL